MLEFLHSKPTFEVEAVSSDGESLTFICAQNIPLETEVRVVDADGHRAEVEVLRSRRTEMGVWVCVAKIVSGSLQAFSEWPEPLRAQQRLEIGLRVRSEHIPGFSALTHDLSERGVQLVTESPLQVGEIIHLTLDLDEDQEPLSLQGAVRWSKLNRPCHAGLLFTGMTPEQRQQLRLFLQHRADPDHVVPRLSESARNINSNGSVLNTEAVLVDVYRQDQTVVIRLREGNELLDFTFLQPSVTTSKLRSGVPIRRICRTVQSSDGRKVYRFRFLDDKDEDVLDLTAIAPQITISTVPSQLSA